MEYGYPFPADAESIHDYDYSEVKEWLNLTQIYQMSYDRVLVEKLNRGNLNKLYKAVKNEMYYDGEPVIISFGEHEVLATSIIKDTPEEVVVGLYDPNYPDNLPTDEKTGKASPGMA